MIDFGIEVTSPEAMAELVRQIRLSESQPPSERGRYVDVGSTAPWKLHEARKRARGRARR